MATFTGTDASETITPQTVSPTVTATPTGAKPGDGADLILAGGGNDIVAAGGGNDAVLLGAGSDTFTWRTGDGANSVEGQENFDTVVFRGNDGNDDITIGAVGNRAVVERDGNGGGSVSTAGVELVRILPGVAADDIEVLSLLGTGVQRVEIDLGSVDVPGPDAALDEVQASGGDGADTLSASVENGEIVIRGLGPTIAIKNPSSDGNNSDRLTLKGFGGDDTLDLSALPADTGMSFGLFGEDGNDTLLGGQGVETMFGGAGDDLLAGSLGADTLLGSLGLVDDPESDTGVDTVSYARSNAAVIVNLATGEARGGHAAGDAIAEVENLIGSRFADMLTGNDKANRLDGGAGEDTIAGGKGNDTYVVDNAGDLVLEKAGEGIDAVIASVNFSLEANVERLVLAGNADIDGAGNNLANEVTGNDGNNVIDGKQGADVMAGGKGDDVYFVDDVGDVMVEAAGGGKDTVFSSVTFTLAANVENLSLFDAAGGVSKVAVSSGGGSMAAATATGNTLANVIDGDSRDNALAGKEGNDVLKGGGGKDQFFFDTALDWKANVDLIADFKRKKDKILLDADIFDGLSAGRLKKDAFYKAKKGNAKEGDDRIGYDKKSDAIYFDADGRGGDKAVKFAVLDDGPAKLSAKDFLIVT